MLVPVALAAAVTVAVDVVVPVAVAVGNRVWQFTPPKPDGQLQV